MTFTFRLVMDRGRVEEIHGVNFMACPDRDLVLFGMKGHQIFPCRAIRHIDVFRTGG